MADKPDLGDVRLIAEPGDHGAVTICVGLSMRTLSKEAWSYLIAHPDRQGASSEPPEDPGPGTHSDLAWAA